MASLLLTVVCLLLNLKALSSIAMSLLVYQHRSRVHKLIAELDLYEGGLVLADSMLFCGCCCALLLWGMVDAFSYTQALCITLGVWVKPEASQVELAIMAAVALARICMLLTALAWLLRAIHFMPVRLQLGAGKVQVLPSGVTSVNRGKPHFTTPHRYHFAKRTNQISKKK